MNVTVAVFAFLWTAALVLVALTRRPAYLLLPLLVFLVHELVFFATGQTLLFRSNDLTQNFYDLALLGKHVGATTDDNYSEGYYGEGEERTPREAEDAKFARFLELMGAKPGDVVLNMGCGTCTFDAFCKARGIRTIGVTLSAEQTALCASKGVEAVQANYNDYIPALAGVADHVVAAGSFEHINQNGGPASWRASYERKVCDTAAILRSYRRYLKPGQRGRILVTVLHQNPAHTQDWALALLQRTFGGLMFLDAPELDVRAAGAAAGLRTVAWEDHTRDYFLATVRDANHFGRPVPFAHPAALAMLVGGVVYPYLWVMWAYGVLGAWMYMFDGRYHVVGINANNEDFKLLPRARAPNSLQWAVFDRGG